ncbi:MAG: hypothetical protein R2932_46385 [Caldilineaceae bacterium]
MSVHYCNCGPIGVAAIHKRCARVKRLIWGLVVIGLLGGCARTIDAAPSVAPSSVEKAGTSVAAATLHTGGYTTSTRMGSEEFGLSKQELVEYIEQMEELIAACMREAGFEYVAVDYNTVRRGMTSDKSLPGYSEAQFMREYGFGIATLYDGKPPQLSARNCCQDRVG